MCAFPRPSPGGLDPRRFSRDERLPRAPAAAVFDYRSPRSWRETAERVTRFGADAILVPWWTSFWGLPVRATFRRLKREAVRRVLLCHNLEDHEANSLKRFLTIGAFEQADAFILHNQENAVEIGSRFPGRKTLSVPLPVLDNAGSSREEARRALGVDGRLVLFLGLIRSYKGVETLLEAAPRIVRETGTSIAIVGEVFGDASRLSRIRD